jgi:hypothetical protein
VPANGGPADAALRSWCQDHFAAEPQTELFRTGHLSTVIGLRLTDGQHIVVKLRDYEARLKGCFVVQRHLFRSGFPCPEPLIGPTPLEGLCASAERMIPDGSSTPTHARDALPYVAPLARLIELTEPLVSRVDLEPKPSWNQWDHVEDGIWPVADDDVDRPLNDIVGPQWLDEAGGVARACLARTGGRLVIGHGDWYWDNLRWRGDDLLVAHDWDSVIAERESVIVGYAASDYIQPTFRESSEFVQAYQEVTNRRFTSAEIQQCWAAVLWLRSFNAKKQLAKREPLDALSRAMAERLTGLVTG